MPTVLLIRHGRTTANNDGVLAGRSGGVHLDDVGTAQAEAVGRRLAELPLVRLVSSPLARCRQTLAAIAAAHSAPPEPITEAGLTECGYGEWTGKPLKSLAKDPLWKTVQNQPSAVTFPDGESMQQMQARAVSAVRRHDAEVEQAHGPDALWVAVSHGDVLKSVLVRAVPLLVGDRPEVSRRERAVSALVVVGRQAELLEVVGARHTVGGLANFLHRWE